MYEIPDGILSYLFIEQSLIYGALSGLIIVPFWFCALFMLFALWKEELWEDQKEIISLLQEQGFQLSYRAVRPMLCFCRSDVEVRITGTPFGAWARLQKTGEKKKRVRISKEEILNFIEPLDPSEPISSLQNS